MCAKVLLWLVPHKSHPLSLGSLLIPLHFGSQSLKLYVLFDFIIYLFLLLCLMNLDAGLFIVRALSCWVFNREVFHSLSDFTYWGKKAPQYETI